MKEVLCNSCRHDIEDYGCGAPGSSVPYRCAISDPRNSVALTAVNRRTLKTEPTCQGYVPTDKAPYNLKIYGPE